MKNIQIDDVANMSLYEMLTIWRFAPSGSIDDNVLEAIRQRMSDIRKADNSYWVQTSKEVGWS